MADLNDRGAVNLTSTSVSTSANELAMLPVSATGDDDNRESEVGYGATGWHGSLSLSIPFHQYDE